MKTEIKATGRPRITDPLKRAKARKVCVTERAWRNMQREAGGQKKVGRYLSALFGGATP